MPQVTFDTSIFIAYKPASFPAGFLLSAVVVQELAAGANDKTDLQRLDAVRRTYEKDGRLLVPTGEDWWLAGKVLNSLWRGLKSKAGGRTPRIPKTEQQRIIRDVLIARTARRAGATVVTDNTADFLKIKRFCAVRLQSGSDYFNR
ncbi:MAG: type II toxin-antitoxin system VapC family toxin [Pyrinomonadaceae bacterium]|nr:type II toxin-antitoxin system VapC family toxin [Pyrinomonadaceae bacterium]MDQ3585997.1 type II toxin-antitoxin system VapC family toxin [Acidobacteriota bacterium]